MTDDDLRSYRPEVRSILRKAVASITIGGAAYAITELTGQEQIWSITMSVFIGGVILVAQFLLDFEARLARVEITKERHSAKIERMVEDGYARINEATELFSLVEASAVRTDAVIQLVRHATLIDPGAPPIVSGLAQAEIGRVSSFLKELSEGGNVSYDGEDRDWLLGLTRHAGGGIDAISMTSVDGGRDGFNDGGFWDGDLGQRYLEAQREAVQRGIRVRRVFIVPRGVDIPTDEGLAAVCRLQREMGIEVRVLDTAAVPGGLRDWLFDFILFDQTISYEVTAASRIDQGSRPTILHTRLELRPDRVRARIQRFKDLWASAHPAAEEAAAAG